MDPEKSSEPYITQQTYLKLCFKLDPSIQEGAMALLMGLEYEGFEEIEEGFNAYIPQSLFHEGKLRERLSVFSDNQWSFEQEVILPTNWNAVWEESYPAVYIDNFCQIISGFHDQKDAYQYTVWIDPKMSFGTGHHATTRLMVRHLQEISVDGLRVLDMGCGTGILGILAAKMGANSVLGIDIDPWSYENGQENVRRNEVEAQMSLLPGDASQIPHKEYALILANINRNVLFEDIPRYVKQLEKDGTLIISGFFPADETILLPQATNAGLQLVNRKQEGDWSSLRFKKL